MKKLLALVMTVAMILSMVAVASASQLVMNVNTLDLPERPEVPNLKVKNYGLVRGGIQYVTCSESLDWLCGIWNWNWVNVTFDDETNTSGTIDMRAQNKAYHCAQGFGTWASCDGSLTTAYAGTYVLRSEGTDFAWDGAVKGVNVKWNSHGRAVLITLETAGTDYFGNGASATTKIMWKQLKNCKGWTWFVHRVEETYEDGSVTGGTYSMNGQVISQYNIPAGGVRKTKTDDYRSKGKPWDPLGY